LVIRDSPLINRERKVHKEVYETNLKEIEEIREWLEV